MSNLIHTIAVVVQVLSALGVILLVLIQHGKGADMGAAFGSGSSGSLFGATGSANFLSRVTAVLAATFFISTLGLAFITNDRPRAPGSLMEGTVPQAPGSVIPGTVVPPAQPRDVPSAGPSSGVPSAGSSSVPPAGSSSVPAAGASGVPSSGSSGAPQSGASTGADRVVPAAPVGSGASSESAAVPGSTGATASPAPSGENTSSPDASPKQEGSNSK